MTVDDDDFVCFSFKGSLGMILVCFLRVTFYIVSQYICKITTYHLQTLQKDFLVK